MADETVDPKYKLMFNLGYNLSNSDNTRKLLQDMIEKTPHESEKQAMRSGRREYMEKALDREGQKITTKVMDMEEAWHSAQDRQVTKENRDEKALLAKYYDGLHGHGDEQINRAIESERQPKQSEKAMSDNDDRDPDPLGPPPVLHPGVKGTPEDEAKFKARTQRLMDDNAKLHKEQEAIDRMTAAREKRQQEKGKDRGRD